VAQVMDRHRAVGSAPEQAMGFRHSPRTLNETGAGVGRFVLHFAEMWIAMTVGMAIFVPVRLALVAQGYAALVDSASIDYEAWMGVFMTVPMVAWMRLRGHGWRMGTEMAGAMLGPIAVVLVLCGLGVPAALPWFSTRLAGPAMAIGMVAIMLYRREHYTNGYAFIRRRPAWPYAR
jgi:hypothetical protein